MNDPTAGTGGPGGSDVGGPGHRSGGLMDLLDSLSTGVLLFDAAGAVTAGNRTALRMLAMTEGQLLGRAPRPRLRHLLRPDGTVMDGGNVPYRSATLEGRLRTDTRFGIADEDRPVRWLTATYSRVTDAICGPSSAPPPCSYVAALTDITQQRRVETRLRLRRERLAATLDASPSAILTFDGTGVVQSVNRAATRMLGFGEPEILGQDVTILIPEGFRRDHRAGLHPEDGRLEWRPSPGSREVLARRSDGSVFPVRLSLGEFTTNGERRIVGILDDLTLQRRAEEYLNGFFSESLDLLSIIDLEGYFVRVSPSFCELLGHTVEELMSRPSLAFIHEDDRESVMLAMDEYLGRTEDHDAAGRAGSRRPFTPFECRFVHKDGSVRWVRWVTSASSDWKLFFGSGQDITAWRADREQLSRLAAVLEKTTDLVVITDPDGAIEYCNHSARDLLGLPERCRPPERILIGRYMPKEDRRLLLDVGIPVAMREGSWSGETSVVDIAGRKVQLSHVVLAHRGHDGSVGYLSMIARDISVSKEVDRLKNEFVPTVSHELRTPLTSIRGSLGLLAGGVMGELPEQADEMVTIARSNAERLIRLINDILDLDKITLGRMELSVQRLLARQVVLDAVDAVRGMAGDAGVTITTRVCDPNAELDADPDRIVQVLTNLLSNAIKFSPSGSEVEVVVGPHGKDRLRFTVRDHGPGIPPDKQQLVFERFQQIDSSNTRLQGGSGLGLAICKGLVEQHGGRIDLVSEEGTGSAFLVDLPLPGAGEPDPRDGDGQVPSGTVPAAVVMTSSDRTFELLAGALRGQDIPCTRARDVLSICKLVQDLPAPLVVLDVRGPAGEPAPWWRDLEDCLAAVPTFLLASRGADPVPTPMPGTWTRVECDDGSLAGLLDELVPAALVRA